MDWPVIKELAGEDEEHGKPNQIIRRLDAFQDADVVNVLSATVVHAGVVHLSFGITRHDSVDVDVVVAKLARHDACHTPRWPLLR